MVGYTTAQNWNYDDGQYKYAANGGLFEFVSLEIVLVFRIDES